MPGQRKPSMRVCQRRETAARIAQALLFLQREATAATLDDVAAAIGRAELSTGFVQHTAGLTIAETAQAATDADQIGIRDARCGVAGTKSRGSK